MQANGELKLVSRRPDGRLPDRMHEAWVQVHRNVPVHGAGVTRQRAGETTVSVLGTLHRSIDLATTPSLPWEEAVVRAASLAGSGPATADPPRLMVLPTPLGRYVLVWRVTMRDLRTYFIDAANGDLVHREDLVVEQQQSAAVGAGAGITGQRKKISVSGARRLFGEGFEARDQLRGAEIVTLDMHEIPSKFWYLLDPATSWEPEDVAFDLDNDWGVPSIVDVHAYTGLTYDYLLQRQQWRGMDGKNGRIMTIANFLWGNALFAPPPFGPEGTGAVAFGSTPGGISFASLDIVSHEIMHGVTFFSVRDRTGEPFGSAHTYIPGPSSLTLGDNSWGCGDSWTFGDGASGPLLCREGRLLLFWNEAGAINEAYSDILGIASEFAFHPPGDGPVRADWLQGEDLGIPSRSLENPGSISLGGPFVYPDEPAGALRFLVAHMGGNLIRYTPLGLSRGRAFGAGAGDYDGVHWNSTILSHSFYLAVEGGRHRSSGVQVAGAGRESLDAVTRIFFRAMTEMMPARGTFPIAAAAIRQSARDLHGAGSPEHIAVDQALAAVGLPAR